MYNEISPGNTATGSYALRGAVEFPLFGLPVMLEGDYRHYRYPHTAQQVVTACAPGTPGMTGCGTVVGNAVYQTGICPSTTDPGCVTVVGFQQIIAFNGLGQAYVPALTAQENEGDVRLGFKVFDPRVYLGAGYLTKSYNYLGMPRLSGVGFGITKLPDLDQTVSLEGSAWYYPRISGNYTFPTSPLLGPLSGQTTPLVVRVLEISRGCDREARQHAVLRLRARGRARDRAHQRAIQHRRGRAVCRARHPLLVRCRAASPQKGPPCELTVSFRSRWRWRSRSAAAPAAAAAAHR